LLGLLRVGVNVTTSLVVDAALGLLHGDEAASLLSGGVVGRLLLDATFGLFCADACASLVVDTPRGFLRRGYSSRALLQFDVSQKVC
jgi:hypothetical protein